MNRVFVLGFALLFSACSASGDLLQPQAKSELLLEKHEIVEPTPPLFVENRVKFSASGDNLIHAAVYNDAQNRAGGNGYDFDYCYAPTAEFYKSFDVNFLNQESLVTDTLPVSHYPCFSSPGEVGRAAYRNGFRVFSLSNNHAYDKGANGILQTLSYWNDMPADVVATGLYSDEALLDIPSQTVNDIRITYLGYSQHTNGIKKPENVAKRIIYTSEIELIEKQVRAAKEISDCVVVSLHWGDENSHKIAEYQRALVKKLSDFGSDVIIGHHPHVIQPVELYKNPDTGKEMLVIYSLANFLSAQDEFDNIIGEVVAFDMVKKEAEPVYIENIKVYPTITHSEEGLKNYSTYLLKDYTSELAAKNSVLKYYAKSLQDAKELAVKYTPEFLYPLS